MFEVTIAFDHIDHIGPKCPNGRALFSTQFRESEWERISLGDYQREVPFGYSWLLGVHEALGLRVHRKSVVDCSTSNQTWIYPLRPVGAFKHWLFSEDANTLFRHCDRASLEAVANTNGYILLDYSFEGNGFERDVDEIFTRMHQLAKAYHIPPSKIIFVFGNLLSEKLYQEWASAQNMQDKIRVIAYPLFEVVLSVEFQKSPNGFLNSGDIAELSLENREKQFLCLNRQQHAHRIALGMLMNSARLIEKGFFSFQSQGFHSHSFAEELRSTFGGQFLDRYSSECQEFIEKLPIKIDNVDASKNLAFEKFDNQFYLQSKFSIVTETTFVGNNVFLSEKTFKPILNCHPFMILGHPYSLRQLKEMGYRTFSPFFNEAYDNIEDDVKRIEIFCLEVRRLCGLEKGEWAQQWPGLQEIVLHNRRHFSKRVENHLSLFKDVFSEYG